jgi:hypothetical protein
MSAQPTASHPYASVVVGGAGDLLAAGRTLADVLQTAPGAASLAVDRLVAVGGSVATGFEGYVSSRFADLSPDAGTAAPDVDPTAADDLLLTALVDIDSGQVLLAAAQAVGEVGPADPTALAPSLQRLEVTVGLVTTTQATSGRFGFTADNIGDVPSPDAPAAAARLRGRTEALLDDLVARVGAVLEEVLTSAAQLPAAAVQAALGKLGDVAPAIPKLGRLVRLGLANLRRAVDTVKQLLDGLGLDRLRDTVTRLWEQARTGQLLAPVIRTLLDVDGARAALAEVLQASDRDPARLDAAAARIADLDARSAGVTETLVRCASGVGGVAALALGIASFAPVVGPWVVPVAAAAYTLILATAVVIAMDHADVGVVRRVDGVRVILETVCRA